MLRTFFNKFRKKPRTRELSVGEYLVDSIYLFENGDYTAAGKQFQQITQAFPEHPLAHLMLGRTLIELKEYKAAIDSLSKHMQIVPNSVEAMIYLGLAYYECDETELAEEKFEQAMQFRENSMLARENLAITRIRSGELEEALDDLIALHEVEPSDTGIVELLVLTLGRLGRWQAAKQYVHQMDGLQPEFDV